MNICFICKYPPIQGGVSKNMYWLIRGLAYVGHHIFVVTNAQEVEPSFRIHLNEEDQQVGSEYCKNFPETGGNVTVLSTSSQLEGLTYIPQGNPTTSRLITKAIDVIRREQCQVIYSSYMEPYGVSAFVASKLTGVPYIFQHAGSDLYRLMKHPELTTLYLEAFAHANYVITGGSSQEKLEELGVKNERCHRDFHVFLPSSHFNPHATPIDFNQLPHESSQSVHLNSLKNTTPLLGLYGKIGESKGSFDLLYAMKILHEKGFKFHLAAMIGGRAKIIQQFKELTTKLKLNNYVHTFPFIPHWKIPQFIRACRAIVFLERDFQIKEHTPSLPNEVFACGGCLVLSEEVARKQSHRFNFRHQQNVIIVPDPKDHQQLANNIHDALHDKKKSLEIGQRAFNELKPNDPTDAELGAANTFFMKVAQEQPVERFLQPKQNQENKNKLGIEDIEKHFSFVFEKLSNQQRQLLDSKISHLKNSDNNPTPIILGELLVNFFNSSYSNLFLKEICQFQTIMYQHNLNKEYKKPGNINSFEFNSIKSHFIQIEEGSEIKKFSFDFDHVDQDTLNPKKCETTYFFANDIIPKKINPTVCHMLNLISQKQISVENLFENICQNYSINNKDEINSFKKSFLEIIEGLYWEGIIALQVRKNTYMNAC